MKILLFACLLIGLTSCRQKPIIMSVDDATELEMTSDEVHYTTKVIMVGTGDTVDVKVTSHAWILIEKAKKP